MTMYGADATNELGNASLVATAVAQSLPAPVFSIGPLANPNPNAGNPCSPRHALISIEGGDVRYRLDGSDVVEPYGILAVNGSVIDWTDPNRDFSAFIKNMSVIAASPQPPDGVLLNISWRN